MIHSNGLITESTNESTANAIAGGVWGTAAGDALGLPCEGLTRPRIAALFGDVPDAHRLLFGRGMISDDTEHTLLVLDALTACGGDPQRFAAGFARGLRRWFCALPAGVGLATLRACLRLCAGIAPARSGVRSAGNGAAMRAAILGAACAGDADTNRLRALVAASTRVTHTDERAEHGALAVAVAARCFARGEIGSANALADAGAALPLSASELSAWLTRVGDSLAVGETTPQFAARAVPGAGVSGYVCHSVPVALHAALSAPNDFRAAVRNAIACGGDTDTVAAITGGIVGAHTGAAGIPEEWRRKIWEPTGALADIEARAARLVRAMASGVGEPVRRAPYPLSLARNALFAAVVIAHGLRRLLPPYTPRKAAPR